MTISSILRARTQSRGPNQKPGGWDTPLSCITTGKGGHMDAGKPHHSLTYPLQPRPLPGFCPFSSISSPMPWIQSPCSVTLLLKPVFPPKCSILWKQRGIICLEGSYAHHSTINAAQEGNIFQRTQIASLGYFVAVSRKVGSKGKSKSHPPTGFHFK